MIQLDIENIHALFNCGAPNIRQVSALGIDYPLKNGWLESLVGHWISTEDYNYLISIKGRKPKGLSKNEWRKQIKLEII